MVFWSYMWDTLLPVGKSWIADQHFCNIDKACVISLYCLYEGSPYLQAKMFAALIFGFSACIQSF